MSFSTPDLSLDEMCRTAKKYGYAGIEPRMDAGHKHGVEADPSSADRTAFVDIAAAQGITLACLATSLKYADPQKHAEVIPDSITRIDLAQDLGIPRLRIFGGAIPDGHSRKQAVNSVTEGLKRVADHAAEKNVTLCLETHDDWCNPHDVAEVMSRADHPAIAVNWDIMHPVRTGYATMSEAYQILKPWIRHVHLHDGRTNQEGKSVLTPIGEGAIDHKTALQCLMMDGYDGYLSGEWINWESWKTHLPRELAALKQYEQDLATT